MIFLADLADRNNWLPLSYQGSSAIRKPCSFSTSLFFFFTCLVAGYILSCQARQLERNELQSSMTVTTRFLTLSWEGRSALSSPKASSTRKSTRIWDSDVRDKKIEELPLVYCIQSDGNSPQNNDENDWDEKDGRRKGNQGQRFDLWHYLIVFFRFWGLMWAFSVRSRAFRLGEGERKLKASLVGWANASRCREVTSLLWMLDLSWLLEKRFQGNLCIS